MEELKARFLDLKEADNYIRYSSSHPIAWYIGLDDKSKYSLFVITKDKPSPIYPTRILDVFIGNRKDGNYGITFSLLDNKNLDLFVHFCEDMIAYTNSIDVIENVSDCVCERYILWQKAFTKVDGQMLSFEQIKGLIGELYFLKMSLMPKYGVEKAIDSWIGIEATDQDFVCDECWFEVKTTTSGSPMVRISSVEQLDVLEEGHLIVVYLDKTSDSDISKITLNSMVDLVLQSIPTKMMKERLTERLLTYGYYYDDIYDKFGFRFNGMHSYKVDSSFPCLRKQGIPVAVHNAKYELSLAAIESYRE